MTNVDIPYVQFAFGIPELGADLTVGAALPGLSSNLGREPERVANVPWASLSPVVTPTAYDLASGYAIDFADGGYVGLNFAATDLPEGSLRPPSGTTSRRRDGRFTFNIDGRGDAADAPPSIIAEQTPGGRVLARPSWPTRRPRRHCRSWRSTATSWADLYLAALTQAGLLRPADVPPAVQRTRVTA